MIAAVRRLRITRSAGSIAYLALAASAAARSASTLFIARALVLLLVASAQTVGAQAVIDPAMTRAQVIAKLGAPLAERTVAGSTFLFYGNGSERRVGMNDVVILEDDKVVDAVFRSKSRRFSGLSSSPVPIPPEIARKRLASVTGVLVRDSTPRPEPRAVTDAEARSEGLLSGDDAGRVAETTKALEAVRPTSNTSSASVSRQPNTAVQPPADQRAATGRIDPESVPRPTMRAVRTAAHITMDGVLDEPAWQTADTVSEFWQTIPRDGVHMPERTVVRVLYDEHNLYVSGKMYQVEPQKLRISGLEHDYPPQASDAFGVTLDPNFDRQNGYIFSTNLSGAVWDGQSFNDNRYINGAWDGVIHVGTHRDTDGWTAEFAIPFTTLRFKQTEGEQKWGINFMRRILRSGKTEGYWTAVRRGYDAHTFSRAGTLTGLSGLRQGRNLQVKPWVNGSQGAGTLKPAAQLGNAAGAGLDVKYGITSRLSLDASLFTDFSQAEVDQEQLNLTRFSLFFPEKREFFMENAGIFTLGDVREAGVRTGSSTSNFTLFHSRRIGLSADRQPIPILGGARLTGRAGDYEIGALDMQTRDFGDPGKSGYTPAENFSVLRLRRYVMGGKSDFGLLLTNRQATTSGFSNAYNRLYAADFNLQPWKSLIVNSYLATSEDPRSTGDHSAARLNVSWRDRLWDISTFVKRVGDGFNPGMGYVQRTGMKQLYATVGAHPTPAIPFVAELNPYAEVSAITDLGGALQTREVTAGLDVALNAGGTISFDQTNTHDRLEKVTAISGVNVAKGTYEFNQTTLSFRPNASGVLSSSLSASHGGFYDGDRTALGVSALFRPDYHFTMTAEAQHNVVTLSGKSFTADVYGSRMRYAYSTKLSAMGVVQFNNQTDELVGNFRITVIHAPLSHIFLVLTERRYVGPDIRASDLLERTLSFKVTRLFQF